MDNFYEYIVNDIEAKKNLLGLMPLNNKTNKKKYNQAIDTILETYKGYSDHVKKYLIAKDENFEVKKIKKDIDSIEDRSMRLDRVVRMLNPYTTYVEKMEIDNLLFDINNYSSFSFEKLNSIINKLIEKFEIVGVELSEKDFDVTCYVNEYMKEFMSVRNTKKRDFEKLSGVFEKIYWYNSDIMEHIELNFRILFKKHERSFENFISREQKRLKEKYNVNDYKDSKEKYKQAFEALEEAKAENIYDIVVLAKDGQIDINNYFKDNKFRIKAFDELIYDKETELDSKFYDSLLKLKNNVIELKYYDEFLPLVNKFKEEFPKEGKPTDKDKVKKNSDISKLYASLIKNNKKLKKLENKSFISNNDERIKGLKITSIKLASDLRNLYLEEEEARVRRSIYETVSDSMLISEVIRAYRNYNYFRRKTLKEVFNTENYQELIKLDKRFYDFSHNPNNIVINGLYAYEENDTVNNIVNKFRFENINIFEEELASGAFDNLINKIDFALRVNVIEKSNLTVEKIWYMVQIKKLNLIEKD